MDFSRNFLTAPVRPHRGGLLFCRCPVNGRFCLGIRAAANRRRRMRHDRRVPCPQPEERPAAGRLTGGDAAGPCRNAGGPVCTLVCHFVPKPAQTGGSAKMAQTQKTPLNRNIERCSADFQPGNLVRVSLKDLWKSSNINGLQVASKAFIQINLKMQGKPSKKHFGRFPPFEKF